MLLVPKCVTVGEMGAQGRLYRLIPKCVTVGTRAPYGHEAGVRRACGGRGADGFIMRDYIGEIDQPPNLAPILGLQKNTNR